MMDFLEKTEVQVVFLSTGLALIGFAFKHFVLDRQKAQKRREVQMDREVLQYKSEVTTPPHDVVAVEPVKQENTKRITGLSHRQIADAIDAVPPFHEDKFQESFIGMTVSWRTKLSGINHYKMETTVVGGIPEGDGCLFCEARREDCDGFILAAKDTTFIVTGQIKSISRYEARLVDCKFTFPIKPPKPGLDLIIHLAEWGIEVKFADVTHIVQTYLTEKEIGMPCEISILGDPRPSLGKILTIEYSTGGKRLKKSFKEHDTIFPNDLIKSAGAANALTSC